LKVVIVYGYEVLCETKKKAAWRETHDSSSLAM